MVPRTRERIAETRVTFDTLPLSLINAYIASGEPRGKAGGYGIQGMAGSFVTSLVGSHYNVVGLPVHTLGLILRSIVQEWQRSNGKGEQ